MLKSALAPGEFAGIAGSAQCLVSLRETIGDQPRVEGDACLPVTEQVAAVLVPGAVNMVDGQALVAATAGADGPVVREYGRPSCVAILALRLQASRWVIQHGLATSRVVGVTMLELVFADALSIRLSPFLRPRAITFTADAH